MLWLIGIASVWSACCALAVALCVMARRGDDAMEHAMARVAASEPPVEVAFVAGVRRAHAGGPGRAPASRSSAPSPSSRAPER